MKNVLTELELYSTTSFQLYGQALDGSQAGNQDYAAVTELKGARIVSEAWLLNLIADYENTLALYSHSQQSLQIANRHLEAYRRTFPSIGVRMKPHLAGDESVHFMNCRLCGTSFDIRDLKAFMLHEGDCCLNIENSLDPTIKTMIADANGEIEG